MEGKGGGAVSTKLGQKSTSQACREGTVAAAGSPRSKGARTCSACDQKEKESVRVDKGWWGMVGDRDVQELLSDNTRWGSGTLSAKLPALMWAPSETQPAVVGQWQRD
jgi:hypothetical protein